MRRIRFNQIFTLLVLLSIISAFFVPAASSKPWSNAQIFFAPVSQPARLAAQWFLGAVRPNAPADSRKNDDIRLENQRLKVQLAQLQGQLETVQKLAAERRQLGPLLNYCVATPVIGADSGNRQSISIQQTSPASIHAGQPVVCPLGLVGRVESAAPTGARVRLITDKSATPTSVSFGRIVRQSNGQYIFQRLPTDKTLVYGDGPNQLIARMGLPIAQVKSAGLQVGDWAVIDDSDYPLALAGMRVGQIDDIRASIRSALYADIYLRPVVRLEQMPEVMVMVKQ